MAKGWRLRIFILYLISGCVFPSFTIAQQNNIADKIFLNNTTINISPNAGKWTDSILKSGSRDPFQVLIQFYAVPQQQERYALAQAGIQLLDYVPDNTFTAIITLPQNVAALNQGNVRSIVAMQPDWKANTHFWDKVKQAGNAITEVIIAFHQNVDATLAKNTISQNAGQIIVDKNMEQFNAYRVKIAAVNIASIAKWYGVKYLNIVSGNVLLDYRSSGMEKANIVSLPTAVGGYGLQGDGVTVGVGDNVSAIYHVDTKDRVINYNPAPISHHGVHINGIVGGAGIIDPNAEGVAPHVTLVDHLYDNVMFLAGVMQLEHNMNVTNNSYALTEGDCSYDGVYDFYSVATDNVCMQYPTVGHVFAAGNDGALNCSPFSGGFGTVIGGYQTAKNSLVVTSTDKMYNDAWDASKGPTRDRRMKPEMSANGADVFSLIGIDVYEVAGGTSMASPQVAGAYALLTQRYRQIFGSTLNPRSDLMKAILVDGATDIGNPGPDYRYGFGLLNLYRSLQILDNHRFVSNIIGTGGSQSFTITVPPNTAQVKVLLYWHDTAASPSAAHQLVNDLDLTVSDVSSVVHKPLMPDTTIANINNNATEQEDHINNIEQVTINNPAAGVCVVTVKGYNVPTLSQQYVVAYDFVPTGVNITYPYRGDVIKANDSFQVYWEASNDSHGFTLEYSTDGGSSWATIDNNIPANQLYYTWHVPNISSDRAMMRLTRNGTSQQSVTAAFTVNPEPVLQLDTIQCPGYINFHWNTVTNASAYVILRKIGPYMREVDTVTSTTYTFSGLSLDSIYYVAIRPIINGASGGFRSLAIRYQPNTGNCSGSFSNGDLLLRKIIAPNSGRKLTSTQLGINENLVVQIMNLDDAACSNYKVSYKLNGGAWISQNFTTPIPANGIVIDTLSGLNLFAAGSYNLQVAVTNLAIPDPVKQNDTLRKTVLHLNNPPINLSSGFFDDFETMPVLTMTEDSVGVSANQHWDYSNTSDTACRLRTFVDDSIVIAGSRAISLDGWQASPGNTNYFTGTFNLGSYDANVNEVRLQFDYVVHGRPKFLTGNQVWVHGYDTQPYQLLYNYNTSSPGQVMHSGSLSVSDVISKNHQVFSPSFQVRFGQNDTSLISARNFGNGVTIDNVKIYTVQNDVQLLNIVSPSMIECGSGNDLQVNVLVYNSVKQSQSNVRLFYKYDGFATVQDTLVSIGGKDTVLFSFKKLIAAPTATLHTLNVWIVAAGDSYNANDSILNYSFHDQVLINSFPYLEDFESGNGKWFSGGLNSSWQYGTPASQTINKAASGTKAWKTNIRGHYNDNELSYLYSPCFDISGLAKPMLSFSFAMQLENCGNILCDAAYIEYSTDGDNWTKLGVAGQGTNWYGSTFDLWNDHDNTRWHVASIPLPPSTQPIRLRFVMSSDPAVNYDGIAIDDIHIFDLKYPVYDGATISSISQNISGTSWADYLQSSEVLTEANAEGQTVNNLSVVEYKHDQFTNPGNTQYYFPRSFVVKTNASLANNVGIRLFIPDNDVVSMLNDTTCPSCSRATDAYSMGVTKYDDNTDKSKENDLLTDNANGVYTFYPYNTIKWVPYDNGYYAELNLKSFSELWLNDGGPTGNFPIGMDYLTFNARRIDYTHIRTEWLSLIDTSVNNYEVQRGDDGIHFSTIGNVNSNRSVVGAYSYADSPKVIVNNMVWYRLMYTMNSGKVYYSAPKRVDWTDENQLKAVYPNPNTDGVVNVQWTANAGTEMKVVISDVTGRTVYTANITAAEWNNTSSLQTGNFFGGIYFMRVQIGGNSFVTKLVYR